MTAPHNIQSLLDGIVTLPSVPSTLARITSLVQEPDVSLSQVGRVIATDPAIALKTLRLVNSAFYGVRQKVTSVEHAVTLLGIKVIQNLVLTATVFDTFHKGADQLFRHSVACGIAMRAVVESSKAELGVKPDDAFVFGLLHDVGKIILEEFLPEEYSNAVQLSCTREVPSWQVEREVIGVDHAELGARLAENWKLPELLVGAITGHHDLDQCADDDARASAASLSVANFLCSACGLGGMARPILWVDENVWSITQTSSAQVLPLVDRFVQELPTVEELIKVAA